MMYRPPLAHDGFACRQIRSRRDGAKQLAPSIPGATLREMYQSGELQQMLGTAK